MNTEKLFSLYGRAMTLEVSGNGASISRFKAFIQPLRYKNKLYLRGRYTEVGKNKEDYYLYIGPPDIDISAVDGLSSRLFASEAEYLVYRTENHYVGEQEIYQWAIIRPVVSDNEPDEGPGEEPLG